MFAYNAPSPLLIDPYTNLNCLHMEDFGCPSRLNSDCSVILTINLRNSRGEQPQFSQQPFGVL